MFLLKKSAILLLCASAIVWAKSQDSPAATTDANHSAASAAGATSIVPDSTKLEPVKMKKAVYPLEASQKGIQGEVVVKMHISETGEVEGVDVLSGDPILAESAVKAAKKWQFKPFIKNGKPIKVEMKMPFDFYFNEKVMNKGTSVDRTATSDVKSTKAASATTAPTPVNSPPPNPDAPSLPQRLRVSQGVSEGLLIHQIAPVYPTGAKNTHVQGHVILKAVIGKDGRIAEVKPVTGPKELIQAAIGAVQQWRYRPYVLMGQPVEVETIIDINFQLR